MRQKVLLPFPIAFRQLPDFFPVDGIGFASSGEGFLEREGFGRRSVIVEIFQPLDAIGPVGQTRRVHSPENERRPVRPDVPVAAVFQRIGVDTVIGEGHQRFDIGPQ